MARYNKNSWTKKEVVRTPQVFNFPPSAEQADMFDFLRFDTGNLHGEAGAGSGKTTTAIRAMQLDFLKRLKIGMMAFNKDIVKDIEPRLPVGVDIKTAHAYGYASHAKRFGKPNIPNTKDGEASKTEIILSEVFPEYNPVSVRGPMKGDAKVILYMLDRLFSMIKATLTDWKDLEAVTTLMDRYNIDFVINDGQTKKPRDYWEMIAPQLNHMMDMQMEMTETIDFADMIWLPLMYNLPIHGGYDMMFFDEWQDASPMMIELAARMLGDGRAMTIGDRWQSIYGWAGADINSIDNTIARFKSETLPLMTTFRCGKKIVEEVNKIMPSLKAFEGNHDGEVITHYDPDEFDLNSIPDRAMVLCRRNSGLVGPCFGLLKKGRKAVIKGKNIGDDLIRLVNSMKADTTTELKEAILAWREEKVSAIMRRKRPSQEAVEAIEDQFEALNAFTENATTVDGVRSKISAIFTDDTQSGVILSSGHKSKGLEAEEVVIVQADRMRIYNDKMKEEDHQQEKNLEYVMKTRAKKKLTMVWS